MFLTASHIFPVEGPLLSPGAIEIVDNQIRRIGPIGLIPKGAPILDLKNHLLLPGFVNAHCHLELTALGPVKTREKAPQPFVEWIRELVQLKNKLSQDEIMKGIDQGIKKLQESGVTTLGDHISFNTPWEKIVESPLRGRLFAEVLGIVPEVAQDICHSFQKIKSHMGEKSSHWQMNISPHSVHAVHLATLQEVISSEPAPLSIHLAESREEAEYFKYRRGPLMDFVRERYGGELHHAASGFQWVKEKKEADLSKLLIVHGNYLTEEEWRDIADRHISVVHCPGSHEFFGHKIFNLPKILDQGINVALGTDSIASNTDLNFLTELNRVKKTHPDLSAEQILRLATLNGARALQMDGQTGSLRAGKKADLAGFKMEGENQPLEQIFSRQKADFLMIDGKRIF